MCKYKESIKNLEHLVNSCGFLAYSKDIEMVKELLEEHKKKECLAREHAREKAIYILQDLEFYGNYYYELEDWLTEVILGNKPEMPMGIVAEQLNCVIRAEIKDIAMCNAIELEDEEVEEILDEVNGHFSEDVVNRDFIYDEVQDFVNKKQNTTNKERLNYLLEKQKVCPLDKEELYELYQLLN